MKYDKQLFRKEVNYYKLKLKNIKSKSLLIVLDKSLEKAFFSIAPLSQAVHEMGKDLHVCQKNKSFDVLSDIWSAAEKKDATLDAFAVEVGKKTDIKNLLKRPEVFYSTNKGFIGCMTLSYKTQWVRKRKWNRLLKAAKSVWSEVYAAKKTETIGIGFELVQKQSELKGVLDDVLDSYFIVWAMRKTCPSKNYISSSSSRDSMNKPCEQVSDLKAIIMGCELSKHSNEQVFKKYAAVSKHLGLFRMEITDATFAISGRGYPGKHAFGEMIGYPTPNGKTRWNGPAGIAFQLDWAPQTSLDLRGPLSRLGFTDTLPIEIFINTTDIDYQEMRRRNHTVKAVCDKCDKIIVKGKKCGGFQTGLEVGLIKKDGSRRTIKPADSDVRVKLNKEYFKRTGIKAGLMANIPSGEAFTTPEYMIGTFIGDVVISIDQSYMLSGRNPLVIDCTKKGYKILKGPKKVVEKFNQKKKESWKRILEQEKHKSVPKKVTDTKKRNFNGIGEFAINTNPKAELCDYLIVNEKIANMIHIALGSGFEPDKATEYHTDIVIDAPRQKLDIYGVDSKGNKHWIHKKGKFVI